MSSKESLRQPEEAPEAVQQLQLLDPEELYSPWRLDEASRLVGLRGVRHAREVLRQAKPVVPEGWRPPVEIAVIKPKSSAR